ncbi:hypothetical protein [Lacinutrix sp. MedPE-SW]|uniref:hypothetical protein n=1 Tax=Lacinutrix sp. MedPE-SW TaxID=1860087 RepID=UPI00090FCDFB|nr:hypothetical protein [Lacinutrix sp. MedPE-SW]OIQ23593.1 MAG: hypothetical protein BM549_03240 [Lacinutrix sp. MedPE-SW]
MKNSKTIFFTILIVVFSVGVAKGFYKSVKKSEAITKEILTVLKDNCNCKAVVKTSYLKGVQYSKKNGVTAETVTYQLTDCDFNNFNQEVKCIDNTLREKINGIELLDLITLNFVNNNKRKTVTIKNNCL